jgi:hypothetical protein
VNGKDARDRRHRGYSDEVFGQAVREAGVQADIDRLRARHIQQRVAVRGSLGHDLRADVGPGAAAIVDEELLPEFFGELRGEQARDHVRAAARRKADNQPHRFDRIALGRCH